MYIFRLEVKKEKSSLALVEDERVRAVEEWAEDRDMGRRLFQAIDTLLEKNGLQPEQISEFKVESEMPDGYTSLRIAETVKRVYTFGVGSRL